MTDLGLCLDAERQDLLAGGKGCVGVILAFEMLIVCFSWEDRAL